MTDPDRQRVADLYADRWWRICNLYRIRDAAGNAVPFVPNAEQRRLWDEMHTLNVIPKARQLGFSTFIAIFICDTCTFRPTTAAGIVDLTIDDAKDKLAKIKYAYDGLPALVRQANPLIKENAFELQWKNGSSVSVGTSHRGGTLQILHVSEFGKISVKHPEKSREIRTGAFGTVHRGQMIFVESTAEGAGGDFYELVSEAERVAKAGRALSLQQFKLHFSAWHAHPDYVDDPDLVTIPRELDEYFRELYVKHHIALSAPQRAWYAIKRMAIGPDDMMREYPSVLSEAFNASVQGAYFQTQMLRAREQGRIGKVAIDPTRPVHTCWDIGKDDSTAVWFFQTHGGMFHFVDYYESAGEGVDHYARMIRDRAAEHGWIYGTHYGPHDLDNSHWTMPGAQSTVDVARSLGLTFRVVPRIPDKQQAIEAARRMLATSWFDEGRCARGIQCLDNYRKKWDDKRGTYLSEPHHDWASHCADAYMTGACGHVPESIPETPDRYQRHRPKRSAWAA